eukprot:5122977-Amphidinium_carterae.1
MVFPADVPETQTKTIDTLAAQISVLGQNEFILSEVGPAEIAKGIRHHRTQMLQQALALAL